MSLKPRLAAIEKDLPWRRVFLRYYWDDHAYVRAVYPNWYKVDDDLFRSAHPGRRRLRIARDQGIRSVLTLRGARQTTPGLIERQAADELGLELRAIKMRSTTLPPRKTILVLLDHLEQMPKPMLVHCKSGADRTGLAVTLYRHVLKGVPFDEARRALSWRYGHWSFSRAGIVHMMLDAYAAARAESGIDFIDWVQTAYDRHALTHAFHSAP